MGGANLVEGILRWKYRGWKPPNFDKMGFTKWGWMVQYSENLKLGKFVDIGAFTYINAKYGVIIDDFVQIGSHCAIYSISSIDGKKGKVVIKRNARIGSHCLIMPRVTVGENTIIGAFSFVNKDVPANAVAFGIPVKVIRRLSSDEVNMMLKAIEEVERANSEGGQL